VRPTGPSPGSGLSTAGGETAKVSVAVVAGQRLLRDLLMHALNAERELEVTAACATAAEAIGMLASQPVDLLLIDAEPADPDALELAGRARAAGYEGPVLLLAAELSEADSVELVRQGVAGIFFKRQGLEALIDCIRQVVRGGAWLDRRTLEAVLRNGSASGARDSRLSGRERAVLRAISEGLSTKETAARLGVSEATVKAVVRRLFDKAGVRNRTQLVRVALERYRHLL
jgi:DNA-binding NarL/FixJ family response regulator